MDAKKIHKNSITGQQGINLIEKKVLEMGFLWYPTGGIEAGIDGTIEIRESATGQVFNAIIQVQSKATIGQFQAETLEGFDYLCDAKDLNYWLQGNAPVILIVSRPSTDEAYWVSIKEYFQDLTRRKAHKVHFSKVHDRFDKSCATSLVQLAIPKEAGIYFSPPLREEQLLSNLLEVTYIAETLYIAQTECRLPQEIWDCMRSLDEQVGAEWILKDKQILSFYNLREYPWKKVCDPGTVECFHTNEWAYAQDAERLRDFVRLLNRALKSKVRPMLLYDPKKSCYYVKATRDLSRRTFAYQSLENKTTRVVFRPYFSRGEPKHIFYYRHSAFEGQFRRFNNKWYLEITPTYYFTTNGYSPSGYADEALKGIKLLERNQAVLGQLVMWASYLNQSPDLFTSKYPFLEFGQLQSVHLDVGIDDTAWLGKEEDDLVKASEVELDELPLFAL